MSTSLHTVPEQSATEGGDRLQSLISKYRSHSEKMESQQQQQQQQQHQLHQQLQKEILQPRVVKPLPGFVSSKIVSKNRFGGSTTPKAPMRRSSDTETPISPLAQQDGDTPTPIMSSRIPKKLPPPPPLPKPTPNLASKSSILRTLSIDSANTPSSTSPSTSTSSQLNATYPQHNISNNNNNNNNNSATSLSSSGLGASATSMLSATGSTDSLNDSSEQKDINALIQK